MQFVDRSDAGHKLAQALRPFGHDAVVYALPRGGVILGAEVARDLGAPMDLILVRKIGHPSDPEYAIGAVADDDEPILDPDSSGTVNDSWLRTAVGRAHAENARRRRMYFPPGYLSPVIEGRTAILVDDGIATGFTMQAAIHAIREHDPERVVVAVPVAPAGAIVRLLEVADDVVVLDRPREYLGSVGRHYLYFPEITDQEVIAALSEASQQSVGQG